MTTRNSVVVGGLYKIYTRKDNCWIKIASNKYTEKHHGHLNHLFIHVWKEVHDFNELFLVTDSVPMVLISSSEILLSSDTKASDGLGPIVPYWRCFSLTSKQFLLACGTENRFQALKPNI